MIKTYGLSHIALAVRDAERSFTFYRRLFGVREVYREPGQIQVQTPGCKDVIVFDENALNAGKMQGIDHFGFRVRRPEDVEAAAAAATRAGGRILRKGDFVPGEPYVFVADPDGYTVEIWYE